MAKSNFLENALLNSTLRGVTFPTITNTYVGLFTAAPNDAGGGTECSGNSYARVQIVADTDTWAAPSDNSGAQETSNEDPITFPESTGAWGTVTHFGLFDASSSGNLLYHGELGAARVVDGAGITLTFPIGELTISES